METKFNVFLYIQLTKPEYVFLGALCKNSNVMLLDLQQNTRFNVFVTY